jgi:hypothetical protein
VRTCNRTLNRALATLALGFVSLLFTYFLFLDYLLAPRVTLMQSSLLVST